MSKKIIWGFMYMSRSSDPERDHLVHQQPDGGTFHVYGVSSVQQAVETAQKFVATDKGDFLELCGAFNLEAAETVRSSIDYKIPVGSVVMPEADRQLFEKTVG